MAVLAQLDVFHSRPIAPTRRVALGERRLPVDPPPGFGGMLLGGIVAAHHEGIDPDLHPELVRLTVQLEQGLRVAQPRLRYRFQKDRVGLLRSRHRLIGDGEQLRFDFEERGTPTQQVLAAVYAAGQVEREARHVVMSAVRKAMQWRGPVDADFVAYLSGRGPGCSLEAYEHPRVWALELLGIGGAVGLERRQPVGVGPGVGLAPDESEPPRAEVLRRFRVLLREAHPDHGAESEGAAQRIADLREARRILLGR